MFGIFNNTNNNLSTNAEYAANNTSSISINNIKSLNEPQESNNPQEENYFLSNLSANNSSKNNQNRPFLANLDISGNSVFGYKQIISFKNPQGEIVGYRLPSTDVSMQNRLIKTIDLLSEYSKQGSSDITPDELIKIQEEMINTFGERNKTVYSGDEGQRVYSSDQKFDMAFDEVINKYTGSDSENGQTISSDEIYSLVEDLFKETGSHKIK